MHKIFAVAFRYAEPDKRYSLTDGKIGVAYLEATDEAEAEKKYGYDGVIAVREITLEQFLLTGYRA